MGNATKWVLGFGAGLLLADEARAVSHIEITRTGDQAEVTWTGGVLQTAPTLKGPWSNPPGATSPHPIALGARAFFRVQETYTVTAVKSGPGTGTVRSVGSGIVCGMDCSEVILSGETVTLQAAADPGSTFTGWSGDCAGTGDCELAVNSAKSVTATFAKNAALNPILNGGFESGGTGWEQQPGALIYAAADLGVQAHGGQNVVRLGYAQDNRRVARIGQQTTLPTATPLFLNFAAWVHSEELCDVPYYDAITIYIAGQQVVNDDRVCSSSNTGGWRQYSIDLTAVAGQTVGVVFEISSVDFMSSILLLDDISISSQSWQ